MNRLFLSIATGIVRHFLTWGGGLLLGQGLITHDQDIQLVSSAMTLLGIGWSAYQKWGQHKAVAVAAAPTDLTGNTAPITRVVDGGPLPPVSAYGEAGR